MVETVRVSEKGQVVIPKRVREKVGIKKGDELSVDIQNGKIVLRKKPENYTEYMWGLHREAWTGVEAAKYVDGERESWRRKEE